MREQVKSLSRYRYCERGVCNPSAKAGHWETGKAGLQARGFVSEPPETQARRPAKEGVNTASNRPGRDPGRRRAHRKTAVTILRECHGFFVYPAQITKVRKEVRLIDADPERPSALNAGKGMRLMRKVTDVRLQL
jgi:hypothetical protein